MLFCPGFAKKTTILTKSCSFKTAPARRLEQKMIVTYLKEPIPMFVPKDIWPSSSPDPNACDFWLFKVIKEQSNATSHPSVKSLKTAIRRAFHNLEDEEVKRSCSAFHQSY